jgi:CheY-like chemotaxis protein
MVLKSKRIFYIEDDLKNRAIAQTILERAGATVGFERWGRDDGIARLEGFKPIDVILLDLMFPGGVTGYMIFDVINAHPDFAAVPVIAVSASDPTVEIPKAQAKGFAGFISKPISLMTFPEQIISVLNGARVWA